MHEGPTAMTIPQVAVERLRAARRVFVFDGRGCLSGEWHRDIPRARNRTLEPVQPQRSRDARGVGA